MFGSNLKQARATNAELLSQIADLKHQRAKVGDSCISEARLLSGEERSRFVALGAKVDDLEAQFQANAKVLAEAEQQNERERNWRAGDVDPDLEAGDRALRAAGVHVPARGYDGGAALARSTGGRFEAMFPGAAHDLAGWGSNSEYLFAIGRGLHDSRLRADSQNEGTSSLGGFLTPPSFFGQVSNSSLESEIVRSRCVVYPMTTRELDIPRFDDLDRSAGAIAGLTLQPVGEGVTMTPQVAKLGLLRLAARKMGLFVEASNELMSDGVAFETTLTSGLARALSFGLDRALLFGAGTGGPQGALSSPVTITVARQKAGAILYDDVLGMFARLAPGCVNTAIWIAHSSTLPSLASLSLVIGVGGSAVPALQQANGTWSLLGRPLLLSEKVSPLGTEADLCLCDFQRYALGVRRDASLDRSVDAGFQRDVTNFRFLIRVDGMPLDPAPITPLSGPTVSPFIKLGAAE